MEKRIIISSHKNPIGYTIICQFIMGDKIRLTKDFYLTKRKALVKSVDNIFWAKKRLGYEKIIFHTDLGFEFEQKVIFYLKREYDIKFY